jgi:hypothetical protein
MQAISKASACRAPMGKQPVLEFGTTLLSSHSAQQKVSQFSCNADGQYFKRYAAKQSALAAMETK